MRKVYITLTVDVVINVDEGIEINELLEGGVDLGLQDDRGTVENTTVTKHEVTDSK